jgi:hypothetical protein
MSTKIDVKNLEQRVNELEIQRKVVITVASVLGFTVVGLFSQLRSAQSEIAELVVKARVLSPIVDASITHMQEAATTQIPRVVTATQASDDPALVMPPGEGREITGHLPGEPLQAVSPVDVLAAQNHAKEMWKVADKSQCRNVRPQDWHRAQTLYELGDQSKAKGDHGRALDKFTEARKSFESCLKSSA